MDPRFQELVKPAILQWIATREPHEAAYLKQLFEQESGYTPHATSGTGAAGLGQITRGTWEDIAKYAARNIPEEELPADISYAELEAEGSYDTYVKRPFANAFMTWANIKRLEDFALQGVNNKIIRSSEKNVPARSLIEAFDGDPRKWAMVVGAGHKDGMDRMKLFTNDAGIFDVTPAREFYKQRRASFDSRAAALAQQADVQRQAGDVEAADASDKRARALSTSDSTGHVFGFGDRLATAIGTEMGLPPLEFTPEEYQDFFDLRAPGHSAKNPAAARFATALETLGTPVATAGSGVSAPTGTFRETAADLAGQVLTAAIPPAKAATPLAPLFPSASEPGLIEGGDSGNPQAAASAQLQSVLDSPQFNRLIAESNPTTQQPLSPAEQAQAQIQSVLSSPEFNPLIAGSNPRVTGQLTPGQQPLSPLFGDASISPEQAAEQARNELQSAQENAPPVSAAQRQALLNNPTGFANTSIEAEQAAIAAAANAQPIQPITPATAQIQALLGSPEFNNLITSPDNLVLAESLAAQQQAELSSANEPSGPPARRARGPAARAANAPAPDPLAVFDDLINQAIGNQLGNVDPAQFNARAAELRGARDAQTQSLQNQAITGLQARLNTPLNLPGQADLLAMLEAGGPEEGQVGALLRSLNTFPTPSTLDVKDISAVSSFLDNANFGGFQSAAASQVLGSPGVQSQTSLANVPLPFEDYGINDNVLRQAQLTTRQRAAEAQQLRELYGIEEARLGLVEQTSTNQLISERLAQSVQSVRDQIGLR